MNLKNIILILQCNAGKNDSSRLWHQVNYFTTTERLKKSLKDVVSTWLLYEKWTVFARIRKIENVILKEILSSKKEFAGALQWVEPFRMWAISKSNAYIVICQPSPSIAFWVMSQYLGASESEVLPPAGAPLFVLVDVMRIIKNMDI